MFEKGVVAFEKRGSFYIVAGEPLAFPGYEPLQVFKEFVGEVRKQKGVVCGYYFSEHFARKSEFSTYYAGASSFVNLERDLFQGHGGRDFRRALNFGKKHQLSFCEVSERKKDYFQDVVGFEKSWLKTRRGSRIGFLLSAPKVDFRGAEKERWFLVYSTDLESSSLKNQLQAFVSGMPYGEKEFYVDHMVHCPEGLKLGLDFALVNLMKTLQQEGYKKLCLGLNPFWGVQPHSFLELGFWLNHQFELLYNSKGLYHFKHKLADEEKPRYLLLDPTYSFWPQLWNLTRVTYF